MNVILLDKVENLGDIGDLVSVKAGYVRNFLLPQGKAALATKEKIAEVEARRAELEKSAAEELAAIPRVKDFRIRRQVSPKNSHAFGISMHFDTDQDFQAYSKHPLHDAFVQERWIPEVEDFQEADFEVIP